MSSYNEDIIISQLKDAKLRRSAFEVVVSHYSSPLYWQIRRLVLSHDDTNDILQNVFLKAWQNIDDFRADSKLSTWLYKICANETLTFLNKNQTSSSIDEIADNVKEQLVSDEYFDGDEVQTTLAQAIATLPARQKEVFNLKYFQELKYEEISEILDTSVGALKASYHHAISKIEKFFNDKD